MGPELPLACFPLILWLRRLSAPLAGKIRSYAFSSHETWRRKHASRALRRPVTPHPKLGPIGPTACPQLARQRCEFAVAHQCAAVCTAIHRLLPSAAHLRDASSRNRHAHERAARGRLTCSKIEVVRGPAGKDSLATHAPGRQRASAPSCLSHLFAHARCVSHDML